MFLNILSASRHSTLAEEEAQFADSDWDYVADNTADAEAEEVRLFGEVEKAAPGFMDSLPPIASPHPATSYAKALLSSTPVGGALEQGQRESSQDGASANRGGRKQGEGTRRSARRR